jgi:uncharacterized protein (DUF885 family)
MKRLVLSILILAVVLAGLGRLYAQSPEDAKLQKMIDAYLDGMWKFFPTSATLAGNPKYNDRLEDFGSGLIEKRTDALDAFNQELVAKVDKSKLSPESQVLHSMMVDALDLEFVKFENILPWEYNPLFYNEILLQSVRGLLVKDGAPLDARVKSATERAKLLPGLIKKAKDNLKTPAQIYTETAIKQMPAIIEFYRTEVPALGANAVAKNGFQTEIAKVVAALEDYQRFLQNELLPKSTGNFRLGADTHLRLLRMTSQGNIPIDELVARANADVKNIRREMFLVCIPFYKIMYPGINLEQLTTQRSEEEVKNIVIKGVLDKIKVDHAGRDQYVAKIAASAANVKSFLAQAKLIDLPDAELAVGPMPAAMVGVAWTRLVPPGAYESNGGYGFQVMPIPADWTNEQATSFLEEQNDFALDFLIVQKVYPGTFVPTFFARKDPSVVKKLYANQALLKGWPAYTEEMLVNSGFGNYDLRLRLNQLKLMLKTVLDFQLELNIHQGGMTKEQAVNYMVRMGFQTDAEAARKWDTILLNPGDAALTYMGYQEILDIEKETKKIKGDAFNQKEFAQKLLSFGAIPLRELKVKLAQ